MPKCKNCKFVWTYDEINKIVICGVDGDCIDMCVAEDDNLGCDLYVEHNVSDNTTKKP